MLTARDALVLFYGVFWATSIAGIGRYHLFDTHQLFDTQFRPFALKRLALGLLVIDLLPILWLWLLYQYVMPLAPGGLAIVAAAIASISFFGFPRILHSIIATDTWHSHFYSAEDWQEAIQEWGRSGPNTFSPHFIPGLAFLVIAPIPALALRLAGG